MKTRILTDLIIINVSAVIAFFLREAIRNYPKESPSAFMNKYLLALLFLNLIIFFLFWLLGAYEKRHKRALLEEFILIFGVISTGISLSMAYFFMGQLWWMSRGVLYIFWMLSTALLCLSRMIYCNKAKMQPAVQIEIGEIGEIGEISEIREDLLKRKTELEGTIKAPFSIIMISYNSQARLRECLPSITAAKLKTLKEIILVDNGSTDGTQKYLRTEHPQVILIENKENLGYSKAVNIGIKNADSELYLILNPDMVILPGSIEIMLAYMLTQPKTGLIGCKLLNEDGTLQYSCRRFLDLRTYLYRFTPIRGIMSGSSLEKSYLMQDWDHAGDRSVDWVLGGCMLARKKACDEVGLMDNNIFLYFEDVDWCYRMWEGGWGVDYVGEAIMVHKHLRTSANNLFNRATGRHLRSLIYFIRKHGLALPKNCPSSLET